MPFESKSLDDYIDVATRIADFRERYPEGTLGPLDHREPYKIVQVEGFDRKRDGSGFDLVTQTFIVVVAAAYRSPEDNNPGVGMAWEVFPGRTNFTRGSELMNAETSAWGRAIIAVGASDSKRGIASREEVRNREAEREAEKTTRVKTKRAEDDPWAGLSGPVPVETESHPGSVSPQQLRVIQAILTRLGIKDTEGRRAYVQTMIDREIDSSKELSFTEAGRVLKQLHEAEAAAAVKHG